MAEPRDHATAAQTEPDEIRLAGNVPPSLDTARQLWLMGEGEGGVLAVPWVGAEGKAGGSAVRGQGAGPRIPLWTATAGQMLCGFAPAAGDGLGLLAV